MKNDELRGVTSLKETRTQEDTTEKQKLISTQRNINLRSEGSCSASAPSSDNCPGERVLHCKRHGSRCGHFPLSSTCSGFTKTMDNSGQMRSHSSRPAVYRLSVSKRGLTKLSFSNFRLPSSKFHQCVRASAGFALGIFVHVTLQFPTPLLARQSCPLRSVLSDLFHAPSSCSSNPRSRP